MLYIKEFVIMFLLALVAGGNLVDGVYNYRAGGRRQPSTRRQE
jgi:hypothetical protein